MPRFGCAHLSDDDFLRAFTEGSIPPGDFHHGDHLRAAWLLLQRKPFDDATDTIRQGLQNLAQRVGVPGHYHETVTRGWMVLLASQRHACTFEASLAALPACANPLHLYWSEHVLRSDAARACWVEPDRATLPGASPKAANLPIARYTEVG